MKNIFYRWLARRAFNSIYSLLAHVPMAHTDHNTFVEALDVLRRLQDKTT